MSCTEEEAKKKWCPFARVAGSATVSFNRLVSEHQPFMTKATICVASECMVWQWLTPEYQCLDRMHDEPEKYYLASEGWNRVQVGEECPGCMKKPTLKIEHYWKKNEPRSGECGLAAR